MIVEKIIQDFHNQVSFLFCKDTSEVFVTKLPSYPEGTELMLGVDQIYHPITEDFFYSSIDKLFTETWGRMDLQLFDRLYQYAYQNHKMNIYYDWVHNPYQMLDYQCGESPVITFEELVSITFPTTFAGKKKETLIIWNYVLEQERQKTGSTRFSYAALYVKFTNFLHAHHAAFKIVTMQELACCILERNADYYLSDHCFDTKTEIGLMQDYHDEMSIYQILHQYQSIQSPFSAYQTDHIEGLADQQNLAVQSLIPHDGIISILSGGPGTGKTTILKHMIHAFRRSYPYESIAMLAPTGRAAERIAEVMAGEDITILTIHKFLGLTVDDDTKFSKTVSADMRIQIRQTHLLIIDESSMVNVSLFAKLLSHLDLQKTKIILVGDIDQLPSIEPGALLRDLIALDVYNVQLTENFRSQIGILENSLRIKNGNTALMTTDDFTLLNGSVFDQLQMIIEQQADTILLSPYKSDRIKESTYYMNRQIHKDNLLHTNYQTKFVPGERVIVTNTKYHNGIPIYVNGDVGLVWDAKINALGTWSYTVMLGDTEREIPEEDLDYGYALTIHKSQGSEYDHVYLVLNQSSDFVTRKMLYTAVTRAKKHVYIFSTPEILANVIANDRDYHRTTFLELYRSKCE